jgi:DNA-binding NarL/FixJ family response regulator
MKNNPSLSRGTVYIIDDHPVIVEGITLLINGDPGLHVVGNSPSWTVALTEIAQLAPEVIVLDITLGGANGIEVLKNLKVHFPQQRVLMLSMHHEELYATRSLKAGAFGYLMKATASEEVVTAIKQILKGEIYLSPIMSRRMISQIVGRETTGAADPLAHLSDRQLEVYQMVGNGLTSRNIAERLHLSLKTIESHKAELKEKLGLRNSAELTRSAINARP